MGPDDTEKSQEPARRPWARVGLFVLFGSVGLGAVLASLAWVEVIPGGWRLRTWVVPQAVRDQRRRADHRAERLAAFAAEDPVDPGGMLFLGSSTIERFPVAETFAARRPINRGIGDEDLSKLEARGVPTVVELRPATVVLYAGSVDVRRTVDDGTWTPPVEIVERVQSLADEILAVPSVEVVILLGILPERETKAILRDRVDTTNRGLSEHAARTSGIFFLPTDRAPLVDGARNLSVATSADRLHLNDLGYQSVAEWLRGLLADLK